MTQNTKRVVSGLMWSRVMPDKFGRPSRLRIPAPTAARMHEAANSYEFIIEDETLIATPTPNSLIIKDGLLVRDVLEQMNAKKQLSDEAFPVRRSGSRFTFYVYDTNPELGRAGVLSGSSKPMLAVRTRRSSWLTAKRLLELLALAELFHNAKINDNKRQAWALELPSDDAVEALIGSWTRARDFIEYQKSAMQRQYNPDEIANRFTLAFEDWKAAQ